ncbi:MAG: hypothetical protein PF795_11835 [Kiritimatiellae bacterium]|jgi:hypothetical protein|nr:hypothetical protein [Kiritimatiellia bacterium]
MDYPNKAVPGGCVIALLGLFSWVYTGLCIYLLVNRDSLEDPADRAELVQKYSTHGVIAFIFGAALMYIGYRLAVRADMSDPYQGPMIR